MPLVEGWHVELCKIFMQADYIVQYSYNKNLLQHINGHVSYHGMLANKK